MGVDTWIALIGVVITNLVALAIFMMTQQRKRQEEAATMGTRLGTMEKSIEGVEEDIREIKQDLTMLREYALNRRPQ